jgi:hypothetical protein
MTSFDAASNFWQAVILGVAVPAGLEGAAAAAAVARNSAYGSFNFGDGDDDEEDIALGVSVRWGHLFNNVHRAPRRFTW